MKNKKKKLSLLVAFAMFVSSIPVQALNGGLENDPSADTYLHLTKQTEENGTTNLKLIKSVDASGTTNLKLSKSVDASGTTNLKLSKSVDASGTTNLKLSKSVDAIGITKLKLVKHTHEWNSWYTVDRSATCTSAGSKSIHCKGCSEKKDVTPIPATGHSYTRKVMSDRTLYKEATCEEDALYYYSCSSCGRVGSSSTFAVADTATGHKYGEWTVRTEPTETEEGLEYRVCEICEDEETRDIDKLTVTTAVTTTVTTATSTSSVTTTPKSTTSVSTSSVTTTPKSTTSVSTSSVTTTPKNTTSVSTSSVTTTPKSTTSVSMSSVTTTPKSTTSVSTSSVTTTLKSTTSVSTSSVTTTPKNTTSVSTSSVTTTPETTTSVTSVTTVPKTTTAVTSVTTVPKTTTAETSVTTVPKTTTSVTSVTTVPKTTTSETSVTTVPKTTTAETSVTTVPKTTTAETSVTTVPKTTTAVTSVTTVPKTTASVTSVTTVPKTTTAVTSVTTVPKTTASVTSVTTVPKTTTSETSVTTVPKTTTAVTSVTTVPNTTASVTSVTTVPNTTASVTSVTTVPKITASVTSVTTVPKSTTTAATSPVTTASVTAPVTTDVTESTQPDEHECEHVFGKWVIDIMPSEETDGEKHRVCEKCGEVQNEITSFNKPEEERPSSPDGNTDTDAGIVENITDPEKNDFSGNVVISKKELLETFPLTAEEAELVENGSDIGLELNVEEITEEISEEQMDAVMELLTAKEKTGAVLDVSIFKYIDGENAGKVTELKKTLKVLIELPDEILNPDRTYSLIREHNGKYEKIALVHEEGNVYSFLSDRFSLYYIAFEDHHDIHEFEEAWTSDENEHWHAASCSHSPEKDSVSAHNFGEWTVTKEADTYFILDGEKARTCEVCGYTETAAVKPEIPFTYGDLNNDGRISASDLVSMIRYNRNAAEYSKSLLPLELYYVKNAGDIYRDGNPCSDADIIMMYRYLEGEMSTEYFGRQGAPYFKISGKYYTDAEFKNKITGFETWVFDNIEWTAPDAYKSGLLYGDVNNDGRVNASDMVCLIQSSQTEVTNPSVLKGGDLDGDGTPFTDEDLDILRNLLLVSEIINRPSVPENSEVKFISGDLNNDGKVSATDLVSMMQYCLNGRESLKNQTELNIIRAEKAGDLNNDGMTCTAIDLTLLKRQLVD